MRTALAALGVLALLGLGAAAYAAQRADDASRVLLVDPGADPALVSAPTAPEPTPVRADRVGRAEPAPAWVSGTAAAAGIPEAAVRAYGRAALRTPEACHLGWATLAGLGWVESHHGSIDGRVLGADGRASTPVVGPPLDGSPGVRAIPASPAGTLLHGDPVWERAIGPMQFLPETWSRWEVDADGDGAADPHDIDDAALAAAGYLCASGDLSDATAWSAAVLSYNRSTDYLLAVHAAATQYAERAAR